MRSQLLLLSTLAAVAASRAIPSKRNDADYCHNTDECNIYYRVGDPASGVGKTKCGKDIFGNNGKCTIKGCTDGFEYDKAKGACISTVSGNINACPIGMTSNGLGSCICSGAQVPAADGASCFTPESVPDPVVGADSNGFCQNCG